VGLSIKPEIIAIYSRLFFRQEKSLARIIVKFCTKKNNIRVPLFLPENPFFFFCSKFFAPEKYKEEKAKLERN
jgi:hypothetical protein